METLNVVCGFVCGLPTWVLIINHCLLCYYPLAPYMMRFLFDVEYASVIRKDVGSGETKHNFRVAWILAPIVVPLLLVCFVFIVIFATFCWASERAMFGSKKS